MIAVAALAFGSAASLRAYATNPQAGLGAHADDLPRGLSLGSLDGGRVDLSDLRDRVVLVHFFATWCEPCRPELASLDRLARETRDRGIEILAVSVAEPDTRLRRFFAEQPVAFPVLLDRDRAAARAWAIVALPSTIVVDRRGTPRLSVRGDLDWQRGDVRAALDRLLDDTEANTTGGTPR